MIENPAEVFLHLPKVFLRVDAYGVLRGLDYGDGDAVFEEAQLLELLGEFELGGRQSVELLERVGGIGVKTEVLVVAGPARPIPVMRDWGARKIEGAAAQIRNHLNVVRIPRAVAPDCNLERRNLSLDVRFRRPKRAEQ